MLFRDINEMIHSDIQEFLNISAVRLHTRGNHILIHVFSPVHLHRTSHISYHFTTYNVHKLATVHSALDVKKKKKCWLNLKFTYPTVKCEFDHRDKRRIEQEFDFDLLKKKSFCFKSCSPSPIKIFVCMFYLFFSSYDLGWP